MGAVLDGKVVVHGVAVGGRVVVSVVGDPEGQSRTYMTTTPATIPQTPAAWGRELVSEATGPWLALAERQSGRERPARKQIWLTEAGMRPARWGSARSVAVEIGRGS